MQESTFYNYLCAGVFSESTIRGLQFYDKAGWKETAAFIEFVLRMWKIVAVKSPSKGR